MTEHDQRKEEAAREEARRAVESAELSTARTTFVVNKSKLALAGVRQVRETNGFHDTFLRLIRGDSE